MTSQLSSSLYIVLIAFILILTFTIITPIYASEDDSGMCYLNPPYVDNSALACTDYYSFVCSDWLANNPRPPSYSSWGKLTQIQLNNDAIVGQLIKNGNSSAMVGIYWQTCMDTTTIDSFGIAPLLPWYNILPDISTIVTLTDYFALSGLLKSQMGVDLLFQFNVWETQFGLLPGIVQTTAALTLSLNLYTQASSQAVFMNMTTNIFQNELGDSADDAANNAALVWQLEKAIAANWDTGIVRALVYSFNMTGLAAAIGVPIDGFFAPNGGNSSAALTTNYVVLQNSLKLLQALVNIISPANMTALYQHARLHMYLFAAPYLGSTQVNIHHDLYKRYVLDVQAITPREIFCDEMVEQLLGDAIARDFYAATFSDSKQALINDMVANIHLSFQEFAPDFVWASPAAQAALQYKDSQMTDILGLPPVLRDYSAANIVPGAFFNNTIDLYQVEWEQDFGQLANPNPHSWAYSPVIVNAFYYPTRNSLNMPVGILQPGMFDDVGKMSYGGRWGAIGTVVGHELSHGFDSSGINFNAQGVQTSWLPTQTVQNYTALTTCFVNEYNGFNFQGTPLNGRQTLGENIADMGGIQLAYRAYKRWLATQPLGTEPIPTMNPQPSSPDQLFFQNWALNWCTNMTDAQARARIATGVHSLPFARVNGPLLNFGPFAAAYNCSKPTPMNPPTPQQCGILQRPYYVPPMIPAPICGTGVFDLSTLSEQVFVGKSAPTPDEYSYFMTPCASLSSVALETGGNSCSGSQYPNDAMICQQSTISGAQYSLARTSGGSYGTWTTFLGSDGIPVPSYTTNSGEPCYPGIERVTTVNYYCSKTYGIPDGTFEVVSSVTEQPPQQCIFSIAAYSDLICCQQDQIVPSSSAAASSPIPSSSTAVLSHSSSAPVVSSSLPSPTSSVPSSSAATSSPIPSSSTAVLSPSSSAPVVSSSLPSPSSAAEPSSTLLPTSSAPIEVSSSLPTPTSSEQVSEQVSSSLPTPTSSEQVSEQVSSSLPSLSSSGGSVSSSSEFPVQYLCGTQGFDFSSLTVTSPTGADWFWQDPTSNYKYYLNPCGTVRYEECQQSSDTANSMLCRVDTSTGSQKLTNIASSSLSTYTWLSVVGYVTAVTSSGDVCDNQARIATFFFTCPSSSLNPQKYSDNTFSVVQANECDSTVYVYTSLACTEGESNSSSLSGLEYTLIGIASGLALLVLIFVALFCYGTRGSYGLLEKTKFVPQKSEGEVSTTGSSYGSTGSKYGSTARSGEALNDNLLRNEVYEEKESHV